MTLSQRSALGWFVVCALLLWSSFAAAQTITPIFADNFESYPAGSFPSGWEVYSIGGFVTNTGAVSPTQSFQFNSSSGLGDFALHPVTVSPTAHIVSVEAWVNSTRSDSNNVIVGLSTATGCNIIAGVRFDPGGTIHAAAVPDNDKYRFPVNATYTVNTWTRVRVDLDLSTATYAITVNNVVAGTGFPATGTAITKICIGADNNIIAGTGGGTTVYVDDVRVETVESNGPSITVKSELGRVWANGHEKTEITVSVLNAQEQGVAGRRIGLSANPAGGVTISPPGGNAMTDTSGKAYFTATSTKIGPVVFTATDVANSTLQASAQVEFIQRRVVVFVQGINTALNVDIDQNIFSAIRQLLVDLGFKRPSSGTSETGKQCTDTLDNEGDGVPNDGCPLILNYSYRDGSTDRTTGIWVPNSYICQDTGNRISASVDQLTSLIQGYAARNPNTRFILIGHSQGGIIALQGARYISPSVRVDALVTLDGALGGAPQSGVDIALKFSCWGDKAASDLVKIWNSTKNHIDQGTTAIIDSQDNATTVASLQKNRTKVVTIGSWDDCVWNPTQCCSTSAACGVSQLEFNTGTQIVRNADVVQLYSLGGNCELDVFHPIATSHCVAESHSRVQSDPQVLNIIKETVGFPTEP